MPERPLPPESILLTRPKPEELPERVEQLQQFIRALLGREDDMGIVPTHALEHELPGGDTVRLSIQNAGTQLNRQRTLNFRDGVAAAESQANRRIDVYGSKLFSVGATDTTTSTTYEDFASLSVSVVVDVSSDILLILTLPNVTHSAVSGECYAIINWNGSNETGSEIRIQPTTPSNTLRGSGASSVLKAAVAAGTYTLKAQIKIATAGTGTYTVATLSALVVPT